jgi:hypothetical protein
MSAGELRKATPAEAWGKLSQRVDLVEAEGLRHSQAFADCVVRLAKAIGELQDQITMIQEAAGLGPDRLVS